jgi:glutathione S-transferase
VGARGTPEYFKMVESGNVTQFIEKNWHNRGTKLSPDDPMADSQMNLFIQMFMEQIASLNFTLMAAPTADMIEKLFSSLLKGLKTVDIALCQHGDARGDFFLGAQYSLAEALTAPFVVRMLANLPHHRGIDVLHICDKMEMPRLKRWLLAVQARPSTVTTTPSHESLVRLA